MFLFESLKIADIKFIVIAGIKFMLKFCQIQNQLLLRTYLFIYLFVYWTR